MFNILQHLSCEKRLRKLRLFSPKKMRLRENLNNVYKNLDAKRMDLCSSSWCPVSEQETVDIN